MPEKNGEHLFFMCYLILLQVSTMVHNNDELCPSSLFDILILI